jgi:hypothetical protein
MAFKTSKTQAVSLDSPEAMYQDIKSRKIEGLLSHQADVLRAYLPLYDQPDVALQLPTGSGKTLIGLTIGEWRRRKFGERVLYLCPTRQLVNQVCEYSSTQYGIKAVEFTGSRKEFSAAAKSSWMDADLIAVTTYSGFFNANTFFQEPNAIIFDDAHAGENYLSDIWSFHLEGWRSEYQDVFNAIAPIFKSAMHLHIYHRFSSVSKFPSDKYWVDKIPTPLFHQMVDDLQSTIDANVGNSDLKWSWLRIRDHLKACQCYIAPQELLIRPLLPPTTTYRPMTVARQRLFMSATLGESGELERITGRKEIKRLPVPNGWDKQGIGRRFFIFPGVSLDVKDQTELFLTMIREVPRSLVLVPSDKAAEQYRELLRANTSLTIFGVTEIEKSKSTFVSTSKAIAVIANRYDGIDFPRDECRLLVMSNMPKTINLQEKFLVGRMGSLVLLDERITTRIVQAFGRCTRSPTDYSAVVVLGDELMTYLLKKETRQLLHPELQAEIRFGIDQSSEITASEMIDNFHIFLKQDGEWAVANNDIVALRDTLEQTKPECLRNLLSAVGAELRWQEHLWNGDYLSALASAREVLTALEGPTELRAYRGLWSYLAGSTAWLAAHHGNSALLSNAKEYFERASKAAPSIPWLRSSFVRPEHNSDAKGDDVDTVIERLESVLESLGTVHDRRFSEKERQIRTGLSSEDPNTFEAAHVELGSLLGFSAERRGTPGAPDATWMLTDDLCIVFEDHSGAAETSTLDVNKARQVSTHPNWVKKSMNIPAETKIVSVLITPVTTASRDALPHLTDVCLWPLNDFRMWAEAALQTVRSVRTNFPGSGDLVWRAQAAEAYRKAKIAPTMLIQELQSRVAAVELAAT